MLDREYYFTPEAVEIAKASDVADIAAAINDVTARTVYNEEPVNPYRECKSSSADLDEEPPLDPAVIAEFNELYRSELWFDLTPEEQRLAFRGANVDSVDQWALLTPDERMAEQLFEVREFAGRVACNKYDQLTLSGAGGVEFAAFNNGLFNAFAKNGFPTKLAFMQFAGAWLCNITSRDRDTSPSITLPHRAYSQVKRNISIGGDIHGDFRMSETLVPEFGALTPFGQQTSFAPKPESMSVRGYHSVEKNIVLAICAHILDSKAFTPEQRIALFEGIQKSATLAEDKHERGADRFADFGNSEENDQMTALDLDSMRCNSLDGEPYAQLTVVPGNLDARLVIEKDRTGDLVLKNNYQVEGIKFRPDELQGLLGLFLESGQATVRTSRQALLHALHCASQAATAGLAPGQILHARS